MSLLEYDLTFLRAAADELPAYLLSREVYWPLGARPPSGGRPYPRFSLGWLLLFRQRVSPQAALPEVAAALQPLDALHEKWRTAWGKKAAQEFGARLKIWQSFWNEYTERPASHASRYAYEVQRRTLLELLAGDASALPAAEVDLLAALDASLRASLVAGGFVDDPAHAAAFPRDKFWFLYGTLKS